MNRINNIPANEGNAPKSEVKIIVIKKDSLEELLVNGFNEAGYTVINRHDGYKGWGIIRERPQKKVGKFLWWDVLHESDPLYIADLKISDPSKKPGSIYSRAKKTAEESGLPQVYDLFTKFFGNPQFISLRVYGEENLNSLPAVMKKIAEALGIDRVNIELVDKSLHFYDWEDGIHSLYES